MWTTHQNTAVEITRGEDHLDIWVDANNNGVRDDDDVEIYVTKSGSMYVDSLHLKQQIDGLLRERVRELAIALMNTPLDQELEQNLCASALELVAKATAFEEQQQH